MRVILIFLDGVGIGVHDREVNPFFRAELPTLRRLLGGELPHTRYRRFSSDHTAFVPVNATLGVEGLPQSGTGQTAIFTGVNGARVFGKHFGPYPPSVLRPVIEKKNIFRRLREKDRTLCFANAFPKRFFEYTQSGTRRLTVTTLACMMSGVKLLTADELIRNDGISADFTRDRWPELGHPGVAPVTPREAGRHLWEIALKHDFTLFEYWLTDHAGHSQKMAFAVDVLEKFDEFLRGLLERFNGQDSLLMLISDHGNIEDLSTKSHTRNQVPCILHGARVDAVAPRIRNLTHITPAIVGALTES